MNYGSDFNFSCESKKNKNMGLKSLFVSPLSSRRGCLEVLLVEENPAIQLKLERTRWIFCESKKVTEQWVAGSTVNLETSSYSTELSGNTGPIDQTNAKSAVTVSIYRRVSHLNRKPKPKHQQLSAASRTLCLGRNLRRNGYGSDLVELTTLTGSVRLS